MQRNARILTAVVVVLLLIGALAGAKLVLPAVEPAPAAEDGSGLETGAGAQQRQPLPSVVAEGAVVPAESASLAFQQNGRVAAVLVEEGQEVEAGAPLIQLESQEQETSLQLAEVSVLEAKVDVAAAELDLAAAEVHLEAAEIALASAQANLALARSGPSAQQVALQNAMIAAAGAGVQRSTAQQALVLQAATPAQIRLAEAELAAAEAEFLAQRTSSDRVIHSDNATDEARAQAQMQLNAATSNVQAAQTRLTELQSGAVTSDRQAVAAGVGAASLERTATEAELELLLAGLRPEAIAVVEAQVAQSQRAVEEAELGVEQAEMLVVQAEAGVAEAETGVLEAQADLDKTTLFAPFAGTVANIAVKVGEGVSAQVPVLTLADMTDWWIETIDLSELDVVMIASGDEVQVRLDPFPDQLVQGQVVDIATTTDAADRGDVVYIVTIDMDDVNLPLRWGMTAVVSVSE